MSARHFEGEELATLYAKFRPFAPPSLSDRIIQYVKEKIEGPLGAAVDVGCGSGQSTSALAPHFTSVTGLDISQAQILQANIRNKFSSITYRVSPAEKLPFANGSVQLVTAGTACHWFDVRKFYAEADRILSPNGVLAVFSIKANPSFICGEKSSQLTNLFDKFFEENLEPTAHPETQFVMKEYKDQKFTMPYEETLREDFYTEDVTISVAMFEGFIKSTSLFETLKSWKGNETAENLLNEYINSVMETLNAKSKREDTMLTIKEKYILLLGRKPSVKKA